MKTIPFPKMLVLSSERTRHAQQSCRMSELVIISTRSLCGVIIGGDEGMTMDSFIQASNKFTGCRGSILVKYKVVTAR
jgi:hypothetical protein